MQSPQRPTPDPNEHSDDTFGMAVTMMAMSVLLLFVIAVIPALGLHLVIGPAVVGGGAILLLHRRLAHGGGGR